MSESVRVFFLIVDDREVIDFNLAVTDTAERGDYWRQRFANEEWATPDWVEVPYVEDCWLRTTTSGRPCRILCIPYPVEVVRAYLEAPEGPEDEAMWDTILDGAQRVWDRERERLPELYRWRP